MRFSGYHLGAIVGMVLLSSCGDRPSSTTATAGMSRFKPALHRSLVWADFGGLHNEAAAHVFLDPWAAASGGSYASDISDDLRLLSGGNVPWDIVNSNPFTIDVACARGLARPLDRQVLELSEYPREYVGRCWVAPWFYGGVLAYNPKLVRRAPKSWADFFNIREFPGARGILDFSGFAQQFEIGAIATGVPVQKVYAHLYGATEKDGYAAMQAALVPWESIRRELIFQSYGSEQLAQLDRGEVVMAMVSTPRAVAAIQNGANIEIAWDTSIVGLSTFMIPSASQNPDIAMEILDWMLDPKKQVEFARASFYGPTSPEARRMIAADPELCSVIMSCPNRLTADTLTIDDEWYGTRANMIVEMWSAWKRGL